MLKVFSDQFIMIRLSLAVIHLFVTQKTFFAWRLLDKVICVASWRVRTKNATKLSFIQAHSGAGMRFGWSEMSRDDFMLHSLFLAIPLSFEMIALIWHVQPFTLVNYSGHQSSLVSSSFFFCVCDETSTLWFVTVECFFRLKWGWLL